jgi:hypothetical protein
MVTNRHLHGYYWYHWLAMYSRVSSPFFTPEALENNKEEEVAEAIDKLHASVAEICGKIPLIDCVNTALKAEAMSQVMAMSCMPKPPSPPPTSCIPCKLTLKDCNDGKIIYTRFQLVGAGFEPMTR